MTPQKTPFAGYEALGPGDSLSADGYAFQSRNPFIADLMAKIGAVLHRHDAHDAMADPTQAPDVEASNTGGSIDAGTAIYVQYTLSDPQGGETLPTDPVQVVVGGGYADPTGAPTAAVDFSAGSMLASTPLYAASITDGLGGETALGPPISVTVPSAVNAQVLLSGLTAITNTASSDDANAGWRLWRSMDGGTTWDLMATGPAATDAFTDDGTSAGDCSVSPLTQGTTGSTGSFTVNVPAGQPGEATFINIYGSSDGTFTSPCLLATLPISDAGAVQTYDAMVVQAGAPPAVSTCLGGANQIDPNTDIINWPWKQPVATVGDLPTDGNTNGDARIVLSDPLTLAVWHASDNTWAVFGTASGSLGGGVAVDDGTTEVDGVTHITFSGLTVADDGSGTATVSGGGGGGTGGGVTVTGSGQSAGVTNIEFDGFLLTFDGSGDVTISPTPPLPTTRGFPKAALTDAFNAQVGQDLATHIADDGSTWSKYASESGGSITLTFSSGVGQGTISGDNATPVTYISSIAPDVADCTAEVKLLINGTQDNDGYSGIWVRLVDGQLSGYVLYYSSGNVNLDRVDNGVPTRLAQAAAGSANAMKLWAIGDQLVAAVQTFPQTTWAPLFAVTDDTYLNPGHIGVRGIAASGGPDGFNRMYDLVVTTFEAQNVQSAGYTFTPADVDQTVESDSATAVTFTVPATLSPGDEIEVCQYGAGQVTIAGDTGVTISAPGGLVHVAEQFGTVKLRMRSATECVPSGDLA